MVSDVLGRYGRSVRYLLFILIVAFIGAGPAHTAPYADYVVDARTGEVLHERNANTQLHPASLTKMMTLYIVFEAIENGELTLDTVVTISANAAAEPPSKIGLAKGQKIAIRHLIRAAAIKSANDAATALGEAVSGSEEAFAARMNRTAKALGMSRTHFVNAHGLTANGHLSTARDMTMMGMHLFYDYPAYYNLFSRRSENVNGRAINNTNRRFLDAYEGADGIKTGFTNAAGFNLVASAQRGQERIIATVFGGQSTAARNAQVAELLDIGFQKAPSRANIRPTQRPPYLGNQGLGIGSAPALVAGLGPDDEEGGVGKTIRIVAAPIKSIRPKPRPGAGLSEETGEQVNELIAGLLAPTPPEPRPEDLGVPEEVVAEAETDGTPGDVEVAEVIEDTTEVPLEDTLNELVAEAGENDTAPIAAEAETEGATIIAASMAAPETAPAPPARPDNVILASVEGSGAATMATPEVVTRLSTSGGHHFGINVGTYGSSYEAERVLLRTALAELATLGEALRKVQNGRQGWNANFVGMTQEAADLACRRLTARGTSCTVIEAGQG
ncbi:D-alanyl-D-alanine carboxypeptidase family protein [Maritimibacter sp. DP1N21-5]|uniref:D-alanyl-D-alanine carboxypeptidase family protein n=1 Tax=Maritimibacter sp. DP1N21-5 TaxID=2836867 RepID=UPI001C480DC2|nr:D-alanyl-D-alanine carboxypeptidase family protein [Maritimibacter sp. DP1N21-5]MBV7408492.1 D-alanyl-D-alanine carboxypeptidase [Maritimibacter sp. DP1N21-5]